MRAREALLAERALRASTSKTSSPSSGPAAPTRRRSTTSSTSSSPSGRSLPHVMMMLVPEAWAHADRHVRGEAGLLRVPRRASSSRGTARPRSCFTDGDVIGATLDRNGLRPAKYVVTKSGLVVLASEFGVLDIEPARVIEKGRLQPGKMFLVDTDAAAHRLRRGDQAAGRHPEAVRRVGRREQDRRSRARRRAEPLHASARRRARARSAAARSATPTKTCSVILGADGDRRRRAGRQSMGIDIPLAVLSRRAAAALPLLQAAVRAGHQPADRSDPRRDRDVLVSCVGGEGNLLEETPRPVPHARAAAPDPDQRRSREAAQEPAAATSAPATAPDALHARTGDPERNAATTRSRSSAARPAAPSPTARSILVVSDRGIDARPRSHPEPARDRRRCTTT